MRMNTRQLPARYADAAAADEPFGARLARWRRAGGMSQLQLALEAGISTRHLGFMEVGRAQPSAAMVQRLAVALGLSGEAADGLRLAAGFAPRLQVSAMQPAASAAMPLAVRAFDAALAIGAAPSREAATERAAEVLRDLGIRHFVAGSVRRVAPGAGIEIQMDACGALPLDWLVHFDRQGYIKDCPLVAHTALADRPFLWSDLPMRRMSHRQRRIVEEARSFGIHNGLVVPLRRSDGSVRTVCAWAERLDRADPALVLAGRLVGTALLDALERLGVEPLAPGVAPSLSGAQRDALGWLREGRSVDWIAQRRALASDTVDALLREACLLLGAADPLHATLKASSLGLLDRAS